MEIVVGNIVPLVAQIECQEQVYYVRSYVFDKFNTLLATLDLDHEGEGKYTNFSYLMPDLELITVQFAVFEDSSYTVESEDYCRQSEIFIKSVPLDVSDDIIKSVNSIKSLIVSQFGINAELEREDTGMEASIESDNDIVIGEINFQNTEIVCNVADNYELKGSVNDSELIYAIIQEEQ